MRAHSSHKLTAPMNSQLPWARSPTASSENEEAIMWSVSSQLTPLKAHTELTSVLIQLIVLARLTRVHAHLIGRGNRPLKVDTEADVITVGGKLPEQTRAVVVGRHAHLEKNINLIPILMRPMSTYGDSWFLNDKKIYVYIDTELLSMYVDDN